MKVHEPLDGEPSRHLVAEDNYAAGYAHQNNIQTDSCPHPQVNLEQSLAHPNPLGVLQPLLPSGQCLRTLSYWQLVDQPLRLIFDFHSVNPLSAPFLGADKTRLLAGARTEEMAFRYASGTGSSSERIAGNFAHQLRPRSRPHRNKAILRASIQSRTSGVTLLLLL